MACGDLIRSELLDCTKIPQGGIGGDSRLVLILKKDITAIDSNAQTQDLIAGITLGANKTGHIFEGFNQSLKPKYRAIKVPAGNIMYIHELDYFVYGYSQQTKNNIDRKTKGRYTAIWENSKSDADAIEVMGVDTGVEVIEFERAPGENNGAMRLKLATPELEPEAKMPRTFFDGVSYATSVALVLGLVKLPSITSFTPLAAVAIGGTAITITGTNYFGGGVNNAVTKVEWINQVTGAVVNQVTFTVASDTSITLNSPAMVAGTYKARIITLRGQAISAHNLIVS